MKEEEDFKTIKITTDKIPHDTFDFLIETTKEILGKDKKKDKKEKEKK